MMAEDGEEEATGRTTLAEERTIGMHSMKQHLETTKMCLILDEFLHDKPLMTRRAINSEIHLHTPTSRQCSKRCLLV